MDYKIIADSSVDVLDLKNVPCEIAPLKIISSEKEYTDNSELNVAEMVEELKAYSGKTTTSCPAVSDWLNCFGESKYIFCITLSSNISGSYNAASVAKQEYETEHPDRKVFVVNSLSAGPQLKLLAEKLEELILSGKEFDKICEEITAYQKHTKLIFMNESLTNFANNGRVNKAVAKIAGMLGIRIVGRASEDGILELLEKARGEKKGISAILKYLKEFGYKNGKVRIAHCFNKPLADFFETVLKNEYGAKDVEIFQTRGLCSFYIEKGGVILSFEI